MDPLNLDDLAEILCAAAIRAGMFFEFDKIATMDFTERVMHVTCVLGRASQIDPWIAKVMSATQAIPILRAELTRRKSGF